MGARKRRLISIVESDCWLLDRLMSGLRGRDFVEGDGASPDESQTREVSKELPSDGDLERFLRDNDVAVAPEQPKRRRRG